MNDNNQLLQINGLDIAFTTRDGSDNRIVKDVSFSLNRAEVFAIVGESGSGKTLIAKSLLGLLPAAARISSGSVRLAGQELSGLKNRQWQQLRGQAISMIFQEPMVSLNPSLRIGYQLCEAMRYHGNKSELEIQHRALYLLERMRIKDAQSCMEKYPHEFSGGMRQRIMIASALMMKPQLLIADEPTTALDCIVQKEVLDTLLEVTQEEGTAVLLISHDLGLVAHYAKRVLVMEKGLAVEQGEVGSVLKQPKHPYTRKLLAALPHSIERPAIAKDRQWAISVQDLCVDYPIRRDWFWQRRKATRVLHNITLQLKKGETLAIVGESGSGKTTLGRAILQLTQVSSGSIKVNGVEVTGADRPSFQTMSQELQLVFQDPFSALSPRRTIAQTVAEPLLRQSNLSQQEIEIQVIQMLAEVGLEPEYASRFPHQLSGGQRQRVSIARALINKPKIIVADEPVSALDITVQAQVLKLLDRLKTKLGFSCIFISHDLAVVEQVADSVVVLYHGRIVEQGSTQEVFAKPAHRYTQQLLSALPELKAVAENSYQLHQRQCLEFEYPPGYREDNTLTNAIEGVGANTIKSTERCLLDISANHQLACLKT